MGKGAAKPKYGFYISLIGGILMLIWGILGLAGVTVGYSLLVGTLGSMVVGVMSVIWGILILIFAYLMYSGRRWGGIIIVILGILNIIVGFDLYFIWSIISIIGGLIGYMGR
jgi:uncharacterized membrane protein (UPF0136 family)